MQNALHLFVSKAFFRNHHLQKNYRSKLKVWSVVALLIVPSTVLAQDAWQIEGYKRTSSIVVDTVKGIARVSTQTTNERELRDYKLEKHQGYFKVMDGANGASVLQLLHLDAIRINDKYASFGQALTAADKLIFRAIQLPNQTMNIEDAGVASEEDGALEQPVGSEIRPASSTWTVKGWWLIPALLLGMIVGLLTPKKRKGSIEDVDDSVPVSTLEVAEEVMKGKPTKQEKIGDLRMQIKTLSATEKQLKQELNTAKQELKAQQTFNEAYYNAAYKKLVLPAQEAMEKGNKAVLLETMIKMSAQYASLTRALLQRKLGHDEANLRYMGEGKVEASAKTISKDTPLDDVPNNVHVLMDMLKQQGSNGLDDTLISGYKIKDI